VRWCHSLRDLEVQYRFLVALPLLIMAEPVVHRRMRPVLQQFVGRNLIPEGAMARFEAAIASAYRLRNSAAPPRSHFTRSSTYPPAPATT
jgi:hypothetical protein